MTNSKIGNALGNAFVIIMSFVIVGAIGLFVLVWPVLMLAAITMHSMPDWLRTITVGAPMFVLFVMAIRIIWNFWRARGT